MVREGSYWDRIVNVRAFDRGIGRTPRLYYLDLIAFYKPERFLDLGCGLATTYNLFKRKEVIVNYTGLDLTSKFVRICKKRYPDANFITGSVEQIPLADNSFDLVACRAVLEHLESPYQAIKEMARVCSKVIAITWFKRPKKRERIYFRPILKFWENSYSREKIMGELSANSLVLVEEIRVLNHLVWLIEKENNNE